MGKRGRPPHPDLLTPRQQEVLTLVREGLSNREIAERLDISVDGAKFHVSEILTKIGASRRSEAAQWTDAPAAPTARYANQAARLRAMRRRAGVGAHGRALGQRARTPVRCHSYRRLVVA